MIVAHTVTTLLHALAKSRAPDFMDLLPDWMNPEAALRVPVYSAELVEAFTLALRNRDVSPSMLRRLDTRKLRDSGWGR